jgi:hypothetical protein
LGVALDDPETLLCVGVALDDPETLLCVALPWLCNALLRCGLVHKEACMSATGALLQGCAQCFTTQCRQVLLCETRVLAAALLGGLATCTLCLPG